MLTREELEDVMNNKPHGYGKQFMKKGMKTHIFVAKPYTKQRLEPIVIKVATTRDNQALEEAQREFRRIHAKNIKYDGIDWTRSV